MKERLNLTIDRDLLEAMKAYAAGKEMSVSELVERYFRSVTKPVSRESILDLVDRLEAPADAGRRTAADGYGEAADRREGGIDELGPAAERRATAVDGLRTAAENDDKDVDGLRTAAEMRLTPKEGPGHGV